MTSQNEHTSSAAYFGSPLVSMKDPHDSNYTTKKTGGTPKRTARGVEVDRQTTCQQP
jgi:hypothetical protein